MNKKKKLVPIAQTVVVFFCSRVKTSFNDTALETTFPDWHGIWFVRFSWQKKAFKTYIFSLELIFACFLWCKIFAMSQKWLTLECSISVVFQAFSKVSTEFERMFQGLFLVFSCIFWFLSFFLEKFRKINFKIDFLKWCHDQFW